MTWYEMLLVAVMIVTAVVILLWVWIELSD